MNKIFKIIWNKTTQRLEVVSELAKSQGKATASTDKRAEVTSAVGFKKSVLLTAISLALGLFAAPSFSANFSDSYAGGWSMAWGKGNQYGNRIGDSRWPIVVGADNKLMPNNDQATFGNPSSATVMGRENNITKGMEFVIFGDRNELHAGNVSTVVGTRNRITNTNGNNSRYLTALGNNIVVSNPATEGLYVGNNIVGNSSPIVMGNRVYAEIGGSAIGHNIFVNARHTDRNGSFLTNDSGFGIGENIEGHGNHLFMGRNITVEKTFEKDVNGRIEKRNIANTATQYNKNSIYVGQNITTKGAKESVLMGSGVKSEDDVGHYSVGVGSNVTLKSGTENAAAFGQHISVTGKNTVAVGSGVTVLASNATAIGNGANAAKDGDIVLGAGSATTTNTNSNLSDWTVSGTNLKDSYVASVKQTDGKGVVSVGSDSVKRQIKYVAAGDVSATSTDAVNGAQLYWLSTKIAAGGSSEYLHVNSTKPGNKGDW